MAPPAGVALPSRPDQLTAEWLTACLRHAGALSGRARVTEFSAQRVGEGHGFAGELTRIALRYDAVEPDAPATLIGKFATQHGPTREMMASMEGYVREVRFYRELSSEVGVPTPRCYLAHYDAQEGNFVLLLEDLAPASPVDVEQGLSVEQAKLVLDQLALLHARWWNRAHEVDWLPLSPEFLQKVLGTFQKSLPGFVSQFGAMYPAICRVALQIGEILSGDEMLGQLTAGPQTLAHNDLHLDNIFLPSANGGRLAFIDWQSVTSMRHGTADVTRIVCVGLRDELRRKHQDALLRHYHTQLLAHGVRGFSLRALRRRFTEEMVSMAMIGVLAFDTIDFGEGDGKHTGEVLAGRIESAIADARLHRPLTSMLVLLRIRRWLRRIFTRVGLLRAG